MGDRANIVVKSGGEQVCLYTHWSGSSLGEALQEALKLRTRWEDFQYLTRIIFCQMVKSDEDSTTGYGITQNVWDGDNRIWYVNVDTQTVTTPDLGQYSFEEYVNLDLEDE